MNTRERLLAVMNEMDTSVPTMKWEFGYWGETLNNWYSQGLPKNNYVDVPKEYINPAASIYTYAWNCENKYQKKGEYPKSMPVTGGAIYNQTQGFPDEKDVSSYFGMDKHTRAIAVNLQFQPFFEAKTIEEDQDRLKYLDIDGVERVYIKDGGFPGGEKWPITDRASWEKIKEERMSFNNIADRFPANWKSLVKEYNEGDNPVVVGGFPHGYFGFLATLAGYENLFMMYYDDPELVHDIHDHITNLWIAIYEEVFKEVRIDAVHIWEDVSMGTGPMISTSVINEFMIPYYKRLTGFFRSKGVKCFFVDTDGFCKSIIPTLMEGGMTALYPLEWHTGMYVEEIRKEFPNLRLCGGIPKAEISKGKKRIDEILLPVEEVLKTGGYIPHCDHFVSPDVDFENFKYYRERLNDLIEKTAKNRR